MKIDAFNNNLWFVGASICSLIVCGNTKRNHLMRIWQMVPSLKHPKDVRIVDWWARGARLISINYIFSWHWLLFTIWQDWIHRQTYTRRFAIERHNALQLDLVQGVHAVTAHKTHAFLRSRFQRNGTAASLSFDLFGRLCFTRKFTASTSKSFGSLIL